MRFIKKVGKLGKFGILPQDAHERGGVQLWSLARVENELARIKAWIHQHLDFNRNLGLWSQMHHDMEILEEGEK